jgi:hypothetical protein
MPRLEFNGITLEIVERKRKGDSTVKLVYLCEKWFVSSGGRARLLYDVWLEIADLPKEGFSVEPQDPEDPDGPQEETNVELVGAFAATLAAKEIWDQVCLAHSELAEFIPQNEARTKVYLPGNKYSFNKAKEVSA